MDHGTGVGETRKGRFCVRLLRIAGYLFFVYATTYFIMMDAESSAFDRTTKASRYDSSFFFERAFLGEKERERAACWANRVFWPMDCVVQPWLKPCNQAVWDQWQREDNAKYQQELDRRLREWEARPRDPKQ
jgi:hypothetical protein